VGEEPLAELFLEAIEASVTDPLLAAAEESVMEPLLATAEESLTDPLLAETDPPSGVAINQLSFFINYLY
jgi:hypothetical protein